MSSDFKGFSTQELLEEAVRERLIASYQEAHEGVMIRVDGYDITLDESRVVTFLYGMLGAVRRHSLHVVALHRP